MPTPKPAQGHINWTTGLNTQVQDPGSKKTVGWIEDDIPPFEFENWLNWTVDLWDKYFEYITDLHITQIATLTSTVATLGTASSISASTAGHTTLTGANVQLQLDETDAALSDIYNAITQGKGADLVGFVMGAPLNWTTAVNHTGDALDQLAARMVTVESAAQNVIFTDKQFSDFVINPADPIDGAGNTGLTSNGSVNPRGLSFSDLTTKYGEEIIRFMDIVKTGKFDSAGRSEHMIVTPSQELRVMFYGDWEDMNHGTGLNETQGLGGVAIGANWVKRLRQASVAGSYFTVTGVFDGIALNMGWIENTNWSTDIEVEIDGVNTGVPLNVTGQPILQNKGQATRIFCDPSMLNLGHNIHTVKFTQNDAINREFWPNGVSLIHSSKYQMPGKAWVNKAIQTYATKTVITDPSIGVKGAKILRYIDRADNTIKEVVNNVTVISSAVVGSVGSGSTTLSVTSGTGFAAGQIIEITDGPTNSERAKVLSVGGNNINIAAPGTVNSYVNPTVSMYGRTLTTSVHTNERVKAKRNVRSFSNGDSTSSEFGNIYTGSGTPYFFHSDDGASIVVPDGNWGHRAAAGNNGYYHSEYGVYPTTNAAYLTYYFVGTGLDVLLDSGTVSAASIRANIDGVDVGIISNSGDENKWYKVCSDLPEGQHCVMFVISQTGTANFSIVDFQEYECAYPSLFDTIAKGNRLSIRTTRAPYRSDNSYSSNTATFPYANRSGMAKGVVCQSILRNARIYSPTAAWSFDALLGPTFGLQVWQGGGAVTGDYIEQWFFGTGVDVEFLYRNDQGIQQISLDGSTATAANFPSMVVQGQGYNSATGKVDCYNVTSDYKRVSFANISATPAWHRIRITITGTKNVSSSAFNIYVEGALMIHNMPFETDMPSESTACCGELKLGGALDLRLKSADDSGVPYPNYQSMIKNFLYSFAAAIMWPDQAMGVKLKTHGYPVRISYTTTWYTNVLTSTEFFILVDGNHYISMDPFQHSTGGYPEAVTLTGFIDLPAGVHSFKPVITGGSTLTQYYKGNMNVEEMVPTRRKLL